MTHPTELLAEYVDGSLPTRERAVVDAHLAECSRCRQEAALAGTARATLLAMPDVAPPVDVASRAIAEAEREASETAPEVVPLQRPRGGVPVWYRWAAAAGAAAALLVVVVSLPNLGGDRTATTMEADAGAGAPAADTAAATALEIQEVDYDMAGVESLAVSARSAASADTGMEQAPADAYEDPTEDPDRLTEAIACLQTAFPDIQGVPTRVIEARFNGTPAYLGVYLVGPGADLPADAVHVWVADRATCSVLSATRAGI
jgi:hypothetical protein